MRKEGECGDAVCIEYFARHFKVKIRLHTCLCKKPLQFPMLLEHKQEPIPVDGESFYRIAHMHVEPDKAQDWSGASGTVPGGVLSANGHYVPIWQASVRIAETPAGTPVWDEKEIEIGGESWADPVTGQEKKRRIDQNTQERGSARRDKIKHDQRTGLLSVVDDTDMQGQMQIREKQAKKTREQIMEQRNFKQYWEAHKSRTNGEMYCLHKASGEKCWFHEFRQVCNGMHETIKIPEGMPR